MKLFNQVCINVVIYILILWSKLQSRQRCTANRKKVRTGEREEELHPNGRRLNAVQMINRVGLKLTHEITCIKEGRLFIVFVGCDLLLVQQQTDEEAARIIIGSKIISRNYTTVTTFCPVSLWTPSGFMAGIILGSATVLSFTNWLCSTGYINGHNRRPDLHKPIIIWITTDTLREQLLSEQQHR